MTKNLSRRDFTYNLLLRLFFALFLCFASYVLVTKVLGSYYVHSLHSVYNIISIVTVCLAFLMFCFTGILTQNATDSRKYYIYPLLLFVSALLLRLIIIQMIGFDTNQTSDFGLAYAQAQKSNPFDILYYKVFSNWGMYVLYLKAIDTVFGHSVLTGIVMNAVLSAASVVLLYYIVLYSSKIVPFALMAAMIFNFWPAHLFYTILLSPDFLAIFLFLGAALLVCIGHNYFCSQQWKKGLIYYGISGIVAGSGNFFKSLFLIYAVDLLIIAFLNLIKKKEEKNKTSKNRFQDIFKNEFTALLISFLIAFITIEGGFLVLDHVAETRVNRNPTAHFLYIGLNPFGNGEWSQETFIYPSIVQKDNLNYAKANNEILQKLKKEISQYHNLNFSFFDQKVKFAWADNEYLYYPNMTMNEKNAGLLKDKWIEIFRPTVQFYYVLVWFFIVIGLLVALIKKERGILLFSMLFVFGFAILLLLIEVQPRYKTVVYPYMSIGTAYGLYNVMVKITDHIHAIRDHNTKNS